MKKVFTTLSVIIGFIFTILIIFTLSGRSSRQTEISNAAVSAMESAVKAIADRKEYQPSSDFELAAAFMEAFTQEVDSKNQNAVINVKKADAQKGVLDVEVIFHYKHPNGNPASISTERTLYLEDYRLPLPDEYVVKFMVSGAVYRKYTAEAGKMIDIPGIPSYTDGTGWVREDGTFAAPGETCEVTEDAVYALE